MATTTNSVSSFRDRPFIVICGCTGTGKTKLSIQLAEWLIKNKRHAEIINADAMQLYKNLDIITNKATESEMKGIKHNLIGYIDYTCRTSTVGDYKNRAVELIDTMLKEGKVPILVGGTNYYIHSVLYDALIDEEPDMTGKTPQPLLTDEEDTELVRMILDSIKHDKQRAVNGDAVVEDLNDLNVRLHDCQISNQIIYEHLKKVDLDSALKLHPNDRRKMVRALQIYYTYGRTKTHLQKTKNSEIESGLFHGPIRYRNACIFALNCDDKVLNVRLDERVDQMMEMGLLKELHDFKLEFDAKKTNQSLREFSRDYQFGIFQSIGFKEFDEYFSYLDKVNESGREEPSVKNDLLKKCTDEMKASTRRYARVQIRWIKNRFVKRANEFSPLVHELDTSDVSRWDETIFEVAKQRFDTYLEGTNELKALTDDFKNETCFEYNKCEKCDKVFVDKFQWDCHLKGNKHKRRLESLKRYENNKRKQYEVLSNNLEQLKRLKENSSTE